jgi:hypothetical protein
MSASLRPNTALAELIRQARWSNGEVARAVNRVGTEFGMRLRYDDSAVCHWLTGTTPRSRVRPLILESFSRRLQRQVTLADAGFPCPAGTPPSRPADIVAGLMELGTADMHPSRRTVLVAAGLFSVAMSIPQYQDVLGRFDALKRNPRTRIGQSEVDTVIAMTTKIS